MLWRDPRKALVDDRFQGPGVEKRAQLGLDVRGKNESGHVCVCTVGCVCAVCVVGLGLLGNKACLANLHTREWSLLPQKKNLVLFYFCEFAFAGGELREEGTRERVRWFASGPVNSGRNLSDQNTKTVMTATLGLLGDDALNHVLAPYYQATCL